VTINKAQVADLGYLTKPSQVEGGAHQFHPGHYVFPNDFQGYIGPGQAVRYVIELEAEGFQGLRRVFEVAWDGGWGDDLDVLGQHLVVQELPEL
jgi:hypothetical protein